MAGPWEAFQQPGNSAGIRPPAESGPWTAFQPAPEAGPWVEFGKQPGALTPGTTGTLSNLARGIGERGAQIGGGFLRFAGQTAEELGDWLEEKVPLGKIVIDESGIRHESTRSGELAERQLAPVIDSAKKLERTDLGYTPGTTWEDVKARPLSNFIPFALEQGIVSAPDMAAVLINLPGYVASQTGQIGQQRAENDARKEATVSDFLKAMPSAVASAVLERIGTKGVLGVDDAVRELSQVPAAAAKGAGKEAATEAVQNPLEYAGATVGTQTGFDPMVAAEQALAGAVGGGVFGGAVRTVTATAQTFLPSPDRDAPPPAADLEAAIAGATADPTVVPPVDPAAPPVEAPGQGEPPADKSGVVPEEQTENNTSISPADLPPSTELMGDTFGPGPAVKKARQASRDWQRVIKAREQGNLEAAKTFEKIARDGLAEAVRLGFKLERKVPQQPGVSPPATPGKDDTTSLDTSTPSAPATVEWISTEQGSAAQVDAEQTAHVIIREGRYMAFVRRGEAPPDMAPTTFDTMEEAKQATLERARTGKWSFQGERLKFEVIRYAEADGEAVSKPVGVYDVANEALKQVRELNKITPGRPYKMRPIKGEYVRARGPIPAGTIETVKATGVNADKLVADNFAIANNPFILQQTLAYQTLREQIERGGDSLLVITQKGTDGETARRITKFLRPLMKRMTPNMKLVVDLDPNSTWGSKGSLGMHYAFKNGWSYIWISPRVLNDPLAMLATLAHEYGHAIMNSRFTDAGADMQQALYNAFQTHIRKHFTRDQSSTALEFVSDLYSPMNLGVLTEHARELSALKTRDYFAQNPGLNDWYNFDEWIAEQTARWMLSNQRAVSVVDRFFKGIAGAIKEVLSTLWNTIGRNLESNQKAFQPDQAVKLWLDQMMEKSQVKAARPFTIVGAVEAYAKGATENAKALGVPLAQAAPPQAANIPLRASGLFGKKSLAQADRYVSWLRFWPNLLQMAWKNPHIAGLQRYVEVVRQWQIDKMAIVSNADNRVKQWRRLTKDMGDRLSKFLFDLETMPYLKKGENARWPTVQELIALAKKHGLNNEAVQVYSGIKADFLSVLDKIEAAWIKDAQRTFTDPAQLAREVFNIQTEMNQLRSKPYFPHSRFGDWTVTVYNPKGKIVHFEQVESAREANRLAARLAKLPQFAGMRVGAGKLAEEVKIFRGLPPSLIKKMALSLPGLTQSQRDAIDQLAYDMSPAQSFAHHMQRRKGTPGYSTEGMRSYANYFLHAGSHIARLQWRADMEDAIKAVGDSARQMVGSYSAQDVGKRQGIADWLSRHFDYIMNPTNEWTALRTFAFTWHLGFNISSALVNLTQIPMVAYPYLAARFGDLQSLNQLKKASIDLRKMYSLKGLPQDEIDAIAKGIEQGFLDESQSADLAGAAQHGVLGRIVPGNKLERFRENFAYWSSFLFQAAEKVNRRVVFRAAYRLAKAQPNSKYVQELIATNSLLYQELLSKGWRPENASAFLAARDAIDRSMFNYSAYARPEFIRGKKGALFAFWMFKQNMLYFFRNDPGAARALVVMFMTAGLMGLPFASDISELAKFFARNLFGKDFDVEREAREMIIELADEDTGRRLAEMFMHGMGKESFGLTWAGEGLGVPIPGIDVSSRLGMGNVIPGLEPLIAGAEGRIQPDAALGRTFQEVVGASYGVPLNILRAVESGNLDEFKTVERLMPTAARNLVRALRYITEGETTRTGAQIAEFDITDTKQAAEVALQSLGFTPTTVSREWDKAAMTREAVQYWGVQRRLLFEEFDKARRTKDREAVSDVREALRRYNRDVPDKRLRISVSDLLESSKIREKNRRKIEAGQAQQSTFQGVTRDINSLFPSSEQ